MKHIISVFLLLAVLTGCIKEGQTGMDLKVGDTLPDFEVMMSDGSAVSDDVLRSSVSVVMFFHTSCPDCQQALPHMQRVYDEYVNKGVSFVLISREDPQASVASFWEKTGLNMPYSAQRDRKVYEKFARERIPRIYICEKGGIIRYIHTDNPVPSYDDLKYSLESVIR